MSAAQLEVGTVEEFDVDAGLGMVCTPQGARYQFHCTVISDGRRQIAVGSRVAYVVEAAGPGRWEASLITPLG